MRNSLSEFFIITIVLLLSIILVPAGGVVIADTTGGSQTATLPPDHYSNGIHVIADVNENKSAVVADEWTQDPEMVTISEALQQETGTVEMIVRIDGDDEILIEDEEITVDGLKQQSERTQEPVERAAKNSDAIEIKNQFWITNAVVLEVDTDQVPVSTIATIDGVTTLEENARIELQSTDATAASTVDTASSDVTYGLDQINAPDVWEEYNTRGETARVAVLDTGIDVSHQDLDLYTENPTDETYPGGWAEFDRYGNQLNSAPYDCGEHGTHVSGTVSGGDASGTHIGVAPDVELMHGGVLMEDDCFGSTTQIIAGMEWAVNNDADIISMSLGGDRYSDSSATAVENAQDAGVVVISSVGNDGEGTSSSPANAYDSLAVGASDSAEDITSFSGGEVVEKNDFSSPPAHWPDEWIVPDVAAPGRFVDSSVPDDGYSRYSGTSMAAPHVSGTAALMIDTNPDLTPEETKTVLRETAWKPDGPEEKDTRYGDGIIDSHAAVDAVADSDITGAVTDADTDTRVENAEITITDLDTNKEVTTVQTNGNGIYAAEIPAEGEFEIIVTKSGYEQTTLTESVDLIEDLSGVDAQLEPAVTVDGTVTEESVNTTISNATVVIGDETYTYETSTDDEGTYSVAGVSPDIDAAVTVDAEGHDTETVPVPEEEDSHATVDVTLIGNAGITGTVESTHTTDALTNTTITVARDDGAYETSTNDEGAFELDEVVGETEYDITVNQSGYDPYYETIHIEDGQTETASYSLTGNAAINGTMIDEHSGESLAIADVIAVDDEVEFEGQIDEDGSYEIEPIAGETTYELIAETNTTGYGSLERTVAVSDAETVTKELEMIGNAAIDGTVVDNTGDPIENVTVRAENDTATYVTETTTDGEYTIDPVVGDTEYELRYEHQHHFADERVLTVDDETSLTVDQIELQRSGTVGGVVTDADPEYDLALANATVSVTIDDEIYVTDTDDEGTYELDVPVGSGDVLVKQDGYETHENTTLDVSFAEHTTHDIELAALNGTISGNVTDAYTSDPLEGATVTLRSGDDTDETIATRTSGPDGGFEIADVPRGEHTLSISLEDYEELSTDLEIVPDEDRTENTTVTGKPGTINGTVTDDAGNELENVSVIAEDETGDDVTTTTDTNGTYEIAVPRGVHELSITKQAYSEDTSSIEVQPNETVTDQDVTLTQDTVYLAVESVETPNSVEQGETLTVDADVSNLGTTNETGVIEYEFNGTAVNHTEMTIESGETNSTSFTYDVGDDLTPGTYEHRIVGDTAVTETIEIEEAQADTGGSGGGGSFDPATVEVSFRELPSDVEPGETIEIDITASNVGDSSTEQEIVLTSDEVVLGTVEQRIPSNNQRFITFSFEIDTEQDDELPLTVKSEDDETSTVVSVADIESTTDTNDTDQQDEERTQSGPDSEDEDSSEADTQDDTEELTEDSDSLPGFGVLVALIAVLGTALIGRDRL